MAIPLKGVCSQPIFCAVSGEEFGRSREYTLNVASASCMPCMIHDDHGCS